MFRALFLIAAFGAVEARPADPCVTSGSDDIEIDVRRQGLYLQTAKGVEPNVSFSEHHESGEGPFLVEVEEDGESGFRFPAATFDGSVVFTWGTVGFEESAIAWMRHQSWFGTEPEMASATGAGTVSFRFDDVAGDFAASLPVSAWSLPTPEFLSPKAGQDIDPTKPVTFQWARLTRNDATDVTLFQIRELDDDSTYGKVVFSTIPCRLPVPFSWVVTMAANATSVTVPVGIFTNRQARYTAHLSIGRYHGTRRGTSGRTWSMDINDQKVTAMPLTILGWVAPPPPRIVVQPKSLMAKPGDFMVFTVTAEGSGTLKYQWTKDGQDIPFANNSTFFLLFPSEEDVGEYRVKVSNVLGTTVSEPAQFAFESTVPVAPVSARLQLQREAVGKLVLTATPQTTGSLILQVSGDLVSWTPWLTQQVVAGVSTPISLPPGNTAAARWFVRPQPGTSKE